MVALLMAATMSVNATPQRGKFIHVDASTSKNLKPQIAFCQDRVDGTDVTTLIVKTVDVNAYKDFTDASRVLIRFADGKAVRLNLVKGAEIKKYKNSEKVGRETISKYWTEAGVAIIKVRVVIKENDAKDYEISEGYQARMAADLLKSYQEAAQLNRKANADLSDEDF